MLYGKTVMEFTFRLAEIMGFDPSQRKGVIKEICKHTGLERHLVAALLHGRTRSINMHALTKLCDFLIEHQGIPPEYLPGMLFGRKASQFWELLACHRSLAMVFGMRKASAFPEERFVSAADILLQADLLHGVSSVAHGSASEATTEARDTARRSAGKPSLVSANTASLRMGTVPAHRLLLEQRFAHSPEPEATADSLMKMAEPIFQEFESRKGDKTLICLGSIKSNPVIELIFARTFGATPFVPQDDVARVRNRSCPIFFRYRDQDTTPPSCCGGWKLSRSHRTKQSGIYYETKTGKWECCPSTPKQGAALVFFAYQPQRGRLESVIGGFSGRDTWYVARVLSDHAMRLWPPSFSSDDLRVGMFIMRFQYKAEKSENEIIETTPKDRPAKVEVISLAGEVIARHLA